MPGEEVRTVLLTGATGFLGRQVLRQLLNRGLRVVCLIRGESQDLSLSRLRCALDEAAIPSDFSPDQVRVVIGDIRNAQLGLWPTIYQSLCLEVDAVFHCAAEVNWVKGYRQLRSINVLGTLELLRFCLRDRPKALTFMSSMAVCFARSGPAEVSEATDMLPWASGMPLGYAKSKCVAESLLRGAASLGLPVSIVRAGLLAGDTQTGRANATDMVSALISACVKSGEAPDADWLFDSMPVDYAAQAIVELALARQATLVSCQGSNAACSLALKPDGGAFKRHFSPDTTLNVFHLRHSKPRHWREVVLWLNLMGFPIQLAPTETWLKRTYGSTPDRSGVLSSYRRLFTGDKPSDRPFEVYLARGQTAISTSATQARLDRLKVREPVLDADLLRLFAEQLMRSGAIPERELLRRALPHHDERDSLIKASMERASGPHANTRAWDRLPFDSGNGLLNEVASVRLGAQLGMRRYRVAASGHEPALDLLIKAKPVDTLMNQIISEVAAIADPQLGQALAEFPQALGLIGSHVRELSLYSAPDARLSAYMPRCYGTAVDSRRGIWSVAIEHLADIELIDDTENAARWPAEYRETAIRDAAQIHAVWYGREAELLQQPWLAPEITAELATRQSPLWHAMFKFAAPYFAQWAGDEILSWPPLFIESIGSWWDELSKLDRTLIHNDFNPRNLAFRRSQQGLQICAFDWELARIGAPQRDLAELLCFVFAKESGHKDLQHLISLHQKELSKLSNVCIAPDTWMRGFVLSMQQLMVERLPFYALVHRFKPQTFLPRVLKNWLRIYEMATTDARPN